MQQFSGFQRKLMIAMLMLAILLGACGESDPEQAVRAQLTAMQTAIDARDAGAVRELLADDFIGNEGMDRRGVQQLAAGVFMRHREVGARIGPVEVELRGERDAIARFTVLATGGSGGLLPESGQVYQVETGWRRVDGEWQLLNANWKPKL
ncbi:MAG: DUF4440 domain-containing protein [Thermomonas sp.]